MHKYVLLLGVLLLLSATGQAQERVITGQVTDVQSGEPIPGANVILKETTIGTVSDVDGNYSLKVNDDGTLVFSFVGYTAQEMEIGNQSQINVALSPDVTSLSEVVVMGYGTQEKKEITSAVASVKAENFNVGNVQNPIQLVQGKVAGLSIVRPGGNPNQGFKVRLRGLSTLGANTEPLVVVDGMIGASLNNIDPNDIASIDVLKDGSAAAIYGSRGASGVILVTTKTGKAGQAQVNYNGYVSVESPARLQPIMNASEWRGLRNQLAAQGDTLGTDYGSDTDWYDKITRNAISQVHNVALAGGNDKTTYRASINYRDVQGIAITTGFKQFNTRLNVQQKALKDKLTLTLNLGNTYRKNAFGFDDAFQQATIYNPTSPVYQDSSVYGGYFEQALSGYKNPYALLKQNTNEGSRRTLNVSTRASYELFRNLQIGASYSFESNTEELGKYFQSNAYFNGSDRNGLARRQYDEGYNQLFESTLSWNGNLSNGTVDAVGGYSYQEFLNQGFHAEGGNFLTDEFGYNKLSAAQEFKDGRGDIDSYKNSSKLIAFFGRLNFAWDNTYFLSASGRYEGSSRFGQNNKWGFFPGISGGVELAKFIDRPSISSMKVRASYGITGNIPADSYLSLLRLGPGNSFFYNGDFVPAYQPNINANPNLRWERKAEINIGLDYALLDSKLFGSVEYYTRHTTDLLYNITVPVPPNLNDRTWSNVGEIRNSGVEVLVNWSAISRDNFSYTPTLTYTHYLKNELVSLSDPAQGYEYGIRDIGDVGAPGQSNTPLTRVEEGKPIGQLWGLVYEGISPDGNWMFKEIGGDSTISNEDRAVIGNGLPKFEFSWGNSLRYGRWDASVFFRGVFGHDLVNMFRVFYEVPGVISSYNVLNSAADLKNPDTNVLLRTSQGKYSSLHVERASFVKLDNFSVGYTFSLKEDASFRSIRAYVSGNNTFVITKYKGSDPEVRYDDPDPSNPSRGDVLSPGIDRRNTWFLSRSFTVGVNLGF